MVSSKSIEKNDEICDDIIQTSTRMDPSAKLFSSSQSKSNRISLQLQAMSTLRKQFIFQCYGTDGCVREYVFHFDDEGIMIADFNASIAPPVVVPIADDQDDDDSIIIPALQDPSVKSSDSSVIVTCAEHRHQTSMKKLRNLHNMNDESRENLRLDMFRRMKFLAEMHVNRLLSLDFVVRVLQDFHGLNCDFTIELICKLLRFANLEASADERIMSILDNLAAAESNLLSGRTRSMIRNSLAKRRRDKIAKNLL